MFRHLRGSMSLAKNIAALAGEYPEDPTVKQLVDTELARHRERADRVVANEALDQYLTRHPFLDVNREGRVVATDLPSSVMCQDQMLQNLADQRAAR